MEARTGGLYQSHQLREQRGQVATRPREDGHRYPRESCRKRVPVVGESMMLYLIPTTDAISIDGSTVSSNYLEDGVELIGLIDWFDPMFYGRLCREKKDLAKEYHDRWSKAYAARGWEFKH